jgi:hypothetical protein
VGRVAWLGRLARKDVARARDAAMRTARS